MTWACTLTKCNQHYTNTQELTIDNELCLLIGPISGWMGTYVNKQNYRIWMTKSTWDPRASNASRKKARFAVNFALVASSAYISFGKTSDRSSPSTASAIGRWLPPPFALNWMTWTSMTYWFQQDSDGVTQLMSQWIFCTNDLREGSSNDGLCE